MVSSRQIGLSFAAFCTTCLLSACVETPTTNTGFRNAPPIVNRSSHNVSRPAAAVQTSLGRFARTCLDGKAFKHTEWGSTSYQVSTDAFFARVVTEEGITSLAVKREQKGLNMVYLDPSHAGPQYFVLADIHPVDASHTRLDIRSIKLTGNKVVAALVAWADGRSQSCPDLTRLGL